MNRKLIFFIALLACLALPLGHLAAQENAAAVSGRLLYNGLTGPVDANTQEMFTMNADGTGQTRLTFNNAYDGEGVWSPDGTRIAFVHEVPGTSPYQLYIMDADGSNPIHLVEPANNPNRPAWSPDGTKLAFSVNESWQVYIVNSDGTGLAPVDGVIGTEVSWSPDGELIAFAGVGLNGKTDIFVVKPDGTGLTNLTRTDKWNEGAPDWSPDGSRLVFDRCQGWSACDLYTISRSGGAVQRLTNTGRPERWPSWSPDGQQIAYVSWTPDAEGYLIAHIFMMNANGSNQKKITNGDGEFYPDWQPAAGAPSHTFLPTNDAYVLQARPNNVFGAKPILQVKDAARDINSYVKFNVTGLAGTVQSATLRLWVTNASPDGGAVYAVSPYYRNTTTLWLETGLNWNNAPAITGAPLGNLGAVAAGRWVEIDVTAGVVAALGSGSRVSFALTNDSTNLAAYSSLNGAHAPELVVVTN